MIIKYYIKRIKNGFKLSVLNEKNNKSTVGIWTVKPKTHSTQHNEADKIDLIKTGQETDEKLFTVLYIAISEKNKV